MIDPNHSMASLHHNARHVVTANTGIRAPTVKLNCDPGPLPETTFERTCQDVRARMLAMHGMLYAAYDFEKPSKVLTWLDEQQACSALTEGERDFLETGVIKDRLTFGQQVEGLYQLTWWFGIGLRLGEYPLFETFPDGLETLFPAIGRSARAFGKRKSPPTSDARVSLSRNFNMYWEFHCLGYLEGVETPGYVFRERARAAAWICYDKAWGEVLDFLIEGRQKSPSRNGVA